MKRTRSFILFLLLTLVVTACKPKTTNKYPIYDLEATKVAATVSVVLTQEAAKELNQKATEMSYTPTVTSTATIGPELPTSTPIPATAVPSSTVVPTSTPTLLTPTTTPAAERAEFIKDVTIPDGTLITAETVFTKTWQIKNIGTTTWAKDYSIVFTNGDLMEGESHPLAKQVKPGESLDISIVLTAPIYAGTYTGGWMLKSNDGHKFGYGNQAEKPFTVSIKVDPYHSDTLPSALYPLDFTAAICTASWKSSFNKVDLPCPNSTADRLAWVAADMTPIIEGNRVENERVLWMHMEARENAWIQGVYSGYQVKDGDHFTAVIGCLERSLGCNVIFSLDITSDSGGGNLGKWQEIKDGKVTTIDIDISAYAGKTVTFLLGIDNKENSAPDVFWLAPAIRNLTPPTVTPTVTITPTITVTPTVTSTSTETTTP